MLNRIQHLLTRPVGRPPKKPVVLYHGFEYQAQSWNKPRRVVAKVKWYQDELFPRVRFIVTNLGGSSRRVTRFYNHRGLAEQWIKEGKYALNWTRLSRHRFDDNQARLQLFVLAYNLGNFLRRLVLPTAVKHWTLTTMRDKLVKIGRRSSGTLGTSCSNWLRWPCRVICSDRCSIGSSGWRYKRRLRCPDEPTKKGRVESSNG
jgi:hypothetical protein